MDVDGLVCKKGKKWRRKRRRKKYIVIAVRRVVSHSVRSTMTAGNAGLDVAPYVCVCVCLGGAPLH